MDRQHVLMTVRSSSGRGGTRTSCRSLRSEPALLELNLKLTAAQVLEECRLRGLVVRSERELAGRIGSHHWHLRRQDRPGTLELNEWQNRVWVKVHPLRDGGWATALAYELWRSEVNSRRTRPATVVQPAQSARDETATLTRLGAAGRSRRGSGRTRSQPALDGRPEAPIRQCIRRVEANSVSR
jgi:hypothetical protein